MDAVAGTRNAAHPETEKGIEDEAERGDHKGSDSSAWPAFIKVAPPA